MNPFAYLDAWQEARVGVAIAAAQAAGEAAYRSSEAAVKTRDANGMIEWRQGENA